MQFEDVLELLVGDVAVLVHVDRSYRLEDFDELVVFVDGAHYNTDIM